MPMTKRLPFYVPLILLGLAGSSHADTPPNADAVYRNGYVVTMADDDKVHQAVAVSKGRIVYVGSDAEVAKLIGPDTRITDLGGRMLMPGLIDAHLHPLKGGASLRSCNLEYAALTVTEFQARIQRCLDEAGDAAPHAWIEVTSWYRQAMEPKGTDATRATLDALKTTRPIIVKSSDGHTLLANSRAIQAAKVTRATKNPKGGVVVRDAKGQPTGIFEDDAIDLVTKAVPAPTLQEDVASAQAALAALGRQGVTSFFSALSGEAELAAFAQLQKNGKLTARAHFAPLIDAEQARQPRAAAAMIQKLSTTYDQGPVTVTPTITVKHVKVFMDGVAQAPAFTASLLSPYLVNKGSDKHPHFVAGANSGQLYLSRKVLQPLLTEMARLGIHPHIHAIGDRAVRYSLDAVEAMQKALPNNQIRPAIAHAEITDPADYGRFAKLNTTPVMSFQWAKPGPDSIDAAKAYLGPERFDRLEPMGRLHAAGARIAFGSDWPVDPLDQWFALKVGVTRTNDPASWDRYPGKLNSDPGLTRRQTLRAATLNAGYALHLDKVSGSLEPGKFADMIVLDRNFFEVEAEEIAKIRVLQTVVGGKVVYQAKEFSQ